MLVGRNAKLELISLEYQQKPPGTLTKNTQLSLTGKYDINMVNKASACDGSGFFLRLWQ